MEQYNRQELEQKLKVFPQSIVFAHLAYQYIQEGNTEQALQLCQAHITNHKKNPFAHYILGLCHFQLNNFDDAVIELELSTYLHPGNLNAWKMLHTIYSDKGDEDKLALAASMLAVHGKEEPEKPVSAGTEFEVEEFIEDFNFGEEEIIMGENAEEGEMISEAADVVSEDLDDLSGLDFDADLLSDLSDEEEKTEVGEPAFEKESLTDFNMDNLGDTAESDDLGQEVQEEILSEFSDLEGMDMDTTDDFGGDQTEDTMITDEISGEDFGKGLSEENEETDFSEFLGSESQQTEPRIQPVEEKSLEDFSQLEDDTPTQPKTMTSTLGEIYISQGKFKEALAVFESLTKQNPTNKRFQRKVNELRDLIDSSQM